MDWLPIVIALVVIVALVVVWISVYNGIVTADNKCDNAWQTIDAQLQRRSDLIPNLVETVRGYAKHESATLSAVTEARAAVDSAPTPEAKMEASNALTDTLRSLFAVAENYPDLKANANFAQLQSELADTENRISYARMSFNDMVLEYNNAIETFPGSLVAGRRFKPRTGFEVASDAARQAPQVKF
ncbi:LemA family protein [Olsenella profusa]|uniref:LemA family protein n=1 Tax=Olsenella profusa TaxID=138595 RepID=A0ABS2F0L8_9ACTN|nr:LemA family protein [Olsenella profusa]MBM6774516.1 LemA family protein [Olsenella profusa]